MINEKAGYSQKSENPKKGKIWERFGRTNNHHYYYLTLVSRYEIYNKTILLITDISYTLQITQMERDNYFWVNNNVGASNRQWRIQWLVWAHWLYKKVPISLYKRYNVIYLNRLE